MSNSKFIYALFLAAPVALFSAGCAGESSNETNSNTEASVSAKGSDDSHAADDGHGHDSDGGHGATAAETTSPAAEGDSAPVTDDGHEGHDHGAEEPAAAAAAAPADEGHEGHDHGLGDEHTAMVIDNPAPLGDGKGARLMYKVGMESHSFGRVMQGTVATHTFNLKNEGTEDLIIKQVKPTCGCTVAQVKVEDNSGEMVNYVFGDAIVPGRKVNVPAQLHTKDKSGHQTTRINIFSNDPRGTIQLGLEADIDPFFNIAPRLLQFGEIAVGDTVEQRTVISTTKGTPVGLTLVTQSLPAGSLPVLTPVNPDADGRSARWDLSVTLGPDLTEGNLANAVIVSSDVEIPGGDANVDGKAKYQATVTITARIVGPFSYNPPYLSMGLVRPGQVAARTVTIVCHDEDFSFADNMPTVHVHGLPEAPTEANAPTTYREWEYADRFTPTVRPVEGKNAVEVQLQLEGMPDNATGSFRGTLVIDLGHKEKESIVLTITGVCRGGPAKK